MIDDKTYDRFLQATRDAEVDVDPVDIRIDGRWQLVNLRAALARLVAERDDAIAQMNDADNATDNATQIAERVVRELRQEYVDVINRLEKQSAAREEALHDAVEQARRLDELYEAACADIGDLQGKMDRLRAEVDSLIEAADAARLLLLFAAGPHEAGAVPAMLAAAIERAKGVKDAKGEK